MSWFQSKAEANYKYDKFIRECLSAGFTDDQADFLWEKLAPLEDKIYFDDKTKSLGEE